MWLITRLGVVDYTVVWDVVDYTAVWDVVDYTVVWLTTRLCGICG